ncbi:protein phosphatase CheZ [Stenotrophomonas sp. W1S232]|jgi:chemotaxis protein CheZ|uniref:Protein phosphatase CheZ n=1 Tax=Stenotrophomonas koreensis TaxID=266128 RepID=A0A7W3V1V7_9GAMM|nr:protein phosphatase CheZ [Stenotrophomonas koreensis]MBB1117929.1 protein phosphatase CheZ [Stenotrophomonas koreensis]
MMERSELIMHLSEALAALETGDEAHCKQHLQAVSHAHNGALLQTLSRLARELGQALGELPTVPSQAGELDDACARLDHVVEMTEQATHRTLDLAEQCRALVSGMQSSGLVDSQSDVLEVIRHNLTEIALTQSYQDITGQIIRRVAGIVRNVHEGLAQLDLLPAQGTAPAADALAGPALAGLDRHAVSQHDADDLLSDLGL